MTAPTLTLADFLLARIAEDERSAQRASAEWIKSAVHHSLSCLADDVVFVARWDPARVLADSEAHRRIVEEHGPFTHEYAAPGVWCRMCWAPGGFGTANARQSGVRYPCPTLRALALAYASHPDYREDWRP